MADIFREIDEELRQERAEQLWRKYGRYVIAGAVVVVLVIAGIRFWQGYERNRQEELGARYAAAVSLLADKKPDDAAALFAAISTEDSSGYGVLARLHQASIRADKGDVAGAIAIYDALAADQDVGAAVRDLATILAAQRLLDQSPADLAAVDKRAAPLDTETGAFRHSAREILGLVALQRGDTAAARTQFEKIADDPDAPQSIRTRATQLLAVLGPSS